MKTVWFILFAISSARTALAQQASPPPTLPIAQHAAATLKLAGYPDFLASDGCGVWVTNVDRVEKVILGSPTPMASAAVPEPCGAMEVGFGALWVASCHEKALYRIDTRLSTVTAVIPTGLAEPTGELSVAVGAGSVWLLTDSAGTLARIDPGANRIVHRISVKPHSYAAAFGFDAVWITNTGNDAAGVAGSVQRIDPRTNRVVATIPVGPIPRFLAAGAGGVWVLNQGDGTVSRVDPATNRVVATIAMDVAGPGGDIAVGANRVWVRAGKVLLSAIDAATNRVVARFGPPMGSGAVRVANDLVWVSAHDVNTLWALRP
jgi:YVTN family beta-propeller protein